MLDLIQLASGGVCLLVFVRTLAMILFFPAIGGWQLGIGWQLGLSLAISIMIAPLVSASDLGLNKDGGGDLLVAVLQNAFFGALLGAVIRIVVVAASWVGGWLGELTGLGLHDPAQEADGGDAGTLLCRFYVWISVLIFFAIGGPNMMIDVLLKSYSQPIALLSSSGPALPEFAGQVLNQSLELALRAGSPILACLMATTIAVALMQRSFPQFNLVRFQLTGNWIVLILATAMTITSHRPFLEQQMVRLIDRFSESVRFL